MNVTGDGDTTIDSLQIESAFETFKLPHSIFATMNSSIVTKPDGSSYSTEVGSLALGAPGTNQGLLPDANGSPAEEGAPLTGYLKKNGKIPSSSSGLQIGSVSQGQRGSLVLGGYDESRLLSNVGVFDLSGKAGDPIVPLIDMTLGVEKGGSPFKTDKFDSLYRAGSQGQTWATNSSIPTILNPTIPYIYLPFGMCEAIAEFLPVTFYPGHGLYIWNMDDPNYERIINSPAYLQFTFQQTSTSNLTIRVPFTLLKLKLGPLIIQIPQPYFPCHPTPDETGTSSLAVRSSRQLTWQSTGSRASYSLPKPQDLTQAPHGSIPSRREMSR